VNAAGALTQQNAISLQSTGLVSLSAASVGSLANPLHVNAPQVRFNATGGDGYVDNAQASSLMGMLATGSARYSSSANIQVLGNVSAQQVSLVSGADLVIGKSTGTTPVDVHANSSLLLQGANVRIEPMRMPKSLPQAQPT
jgi:hypothetical protein